MKGKNLFLGVILLSLLSIGLFLMSSKLLAHCDTMDGPVVKAAQKALKTGNVNLVLIWVQKKDGTEIKSAFEKTLAVRKLSPQAKDLADMYFFETLVRIHRAGEGAPYTGLKPAGTDLGPVIPASDKAIEDGSAKGLVKLLGDSIQTNVPKHFQELMAKKKYAENDVEAGRMFVKVYVIFTHYVEAIYDSAKNPADGHQETPAGEVHK
jgi:hypothetical protein